MDCCQNGHRLFVSEKQCVGRESVLTAKNKPGQTEKMIKHFRKGKQL